MLGARTNRYGDFLDIACAISGCAPDVGLHRPENRTARVIFDVTTLPLSFLQTEIAWPILGTLYGRELGNTVGVVAGVSTHPGEDRLKAFGAAAASSGSVGLFHIAGVTPEAPDLETALGHQPPDAIIHVNAEMVSDAKARLSTVARADRIDAVAIGSPHLSLAEFDQLERIIAGRRLRVPIHACTGRHILAELEFDWKTLTPRSIGRGHRCRHLRGRHADPARAVRRCSDDQFRQVRPLRARQYRLRRALCLAGRLCRKRSVRQARIQ